MASRVQVGLVMVIVAMFWARATAQSSCTNVLIGMAPCLNYVTGSSSTPSSSCCSQLATVVRSQPQCLCFALNGGGASLGININRTLALALPAACNVQTPPVSRCNAANSPVGSPQGLPDDTPTSSSSTGSKIVPATGGSSFAAKVSVCLPLQLVVFVLFLYGFICASV